MLEPETSQYSLEYEAIWFSRTPMGRVSLENHQDGSKVSRCRVALATTSNKGGINRVPFSRSVVYFVDDGVGSRAGSS